MIRMMVDMVGVCPGHDESAGINHSHRSPSGNRQMRRLLNQSAHAAVKTKASIFEFLYWRFVVRLGHAQAISAIAHRLCRLVWKILHDNVTYEERGPVVNKARAHRRVTKMLRELRSLGYRVELIPAASGNALLTATGPLTPGFCDPSRAGAVHRSSCRRLRRDLLSNSARPATSPVRIPSTQRPHSNSAIAPKTWSRRRGRAVFKQHYEHKSGGL